jgi:hypothetical protein
MNSHLIFKQQKQAAEKLNTNINNLKNRVYVTGFKV